jgi:hypothetical protein
LDGTYKSNGHSNVFIAAIDRTKTMHYIVITSKIDDSSENALRLHISSGIMSRQRSSRQILLFLGGIQTEKTTLDAGHNLQQSEASRL